MNGLENILQEFAGEKNSAFYRAVEEHFRQQSLVKHEAQDGYKNIFCESNAVNLLIEPDNGEILKANKAACSYYQYSPDELIGKSIKEINTLTDKEVEAEMQRAKLQERNHFLFRHQLGTKEVRHVEVYSQPVTFGGAQVLHSVIFDIEEKVRAQNDLNRFKTAVIQNPATIVITDLDANIQYVNPRFTQLTGYTAKEAYGENPRILKSGRTPDQVYKEMWTDLVNGKTWKGEFANQRKNGDVFWEQATISPTFDESGRISGYIAIKEDITEKKRYKEKLIALNENLQVQNEELNAAYGELNTINEKIHSTNETLKKEREQFLSILNSIPEPIYVSDKESYKILFANKELKQIAGPDVVGKECYVAIQNRTEVCEFCKHEQVFQQEEPCFWEHYNESISKTFYIIDRAMKWMDGRDVHFQIAIDITERKKAEDKLREAEHNLLEHSEQLAESNATKDKFFSIIAHDLKNPFNSIMGISRILHEKIDIYDKETIKKYAGYILESSEGSYKLLQSLLEWSRSQMGKIAYKPEVHNLFDMTDEVLGSLYSQMNAKGVKVQIDVKPDLKVYADWNMVTTIIRNLLSNAIKFSYRDGSIELHARDRGSFVEVAVEDHGKGMPENVREKLFRISEKVTMPGTEQERGTGLGLLLCKDFVIRHGGDISVKSEPEKGSTFIFTLPDKK